MLRIRVGKVVIHIPRAATLLDRRRVRDEQHEQRAQHDGIVVLADRAQEARGVVRDHADELEEAHDGRREHDTRDLALLAAVAVREQVCSADAEAENDADDCATCCDVAGYLVECAVANDGLDRVA